jgi:Zn-dependent proteases
MLNDLTWFLSNFHFYIPALVIAFTVHEFAHAYVSFKLGDTGVKDDKRLSLNPINHIDPMGLLLLFIVGFGWAKPVVVNPSAYKNPVKGNMLVALAGPMSNFVLAFLAIIFHIIFIDTSLVMFFYYLWVINIGLGIFNLIPIPPLDGSHILGYFMKAESLKQYLENKWIGWVILMFIIMTDFMSYILTPINEFIIKIIY